MDKEKIRSDFLQNYKAKLTSLQSSIEENKRQAWNSPGANTSHSDTNKFTLSNLALGQSMVLDEIARAVSFLETLKISPSKRIILGSVFITKAMDTNEINTYFVINIAGGETITAQNGEKITAISVSSPLAQHSIGKEEGDYVLIPIKGLGKREFEIMEIF